MKKSILKSVLAYLIYFIVFLAFGFVIKLFFFEYDLITIHKDYFLFTDTLFFLILIVGGLLYTQKQQTNKLPIRASIKAKDVFFFCFLALVFRLFEDPIFRIEFIFDKVRLYELEIDSINDRGHLVLISNLLNIVLLGVIFEELFFRRIFFSFFDRKKYLFAIMISSIFFSVSHLENFQFDFSILITTFIFSVIAGVIYLRKSIYHSIIFHSAYNLVWLVLSENNVEYWNVLRKLNFGVLYWVIILFSTIVVFWFVKKSMQELNIES